MANLTSVTLTNGVPTVGTGAVSTIDALMLQLATSPLPLPTGGATAALQAATITALGSRRCRRFGSYIFAGRSDHANSRADYCATAGNIPACAKQQPVGYICADDSLYRAANGAPSASSTTQIKRRLHRDGL